MAQVAVSALKPEEKDRLVCTYAALLLHDGELEISVSNSFRSSVWRFWPSYALQEEKLSKVIKASGNTVEGYWPGLFAKALKGQDITALLANVGTGGGSGGAAADAGAAGGDAPAKEEEKPSKYLFPS